MSDSNEKEARPLLSREFKKDVRGISLPRPRCHKPVRGKTYSSGIMGYWCSRPRTRTFLAIQGWFDLSEV